MTTFDPITVDYAIEQCTDLDKLRYLARSYRKVMIQQHEFAGHLFEIDTCEPCTEAFVHSDPDLACDEYKAWQQAYEEALRADRILS
jgi:hypothetical protein